MGENVLTGALIWCILAIIALMAGWVMNLVTLIHLAQHGGDITVMALVRIAGVFIPVIGGVLGWF